MAVHSDSQEARQSTGDTGFRDLLDQFDVRENEFLLNQQSTKSQSKPFGRHSGITWEQFGISILDRIPWNGFCFDNPAIIGIQLQPHGPIEILERELIFSGFFVHVSIFKCKFFLPCEWFPLHLYYTTLEVDIVGISTCTADEFIMSRHYKSRYSIHVCINDLFIVLFWFKGIVKKETHMIKISKSNKTIICLTTILILSLIVLELSTGVFYSYADSKLDTVDNSSQMSLIENDLDNADSSNEIIS